jgi:hypothetical protein
MNDGVRDGPSEGLARHSDIRLTLGVDTHADVPDQAAAIGTLPGPPK